MGLGLATRELELIIIAHDRASSTLARVGGGLAILGAGMTRLGIEGIEALSSMTAEAIDFEKQVALAYTQVFDKSQTTLQDVENVIVNVARSVGAPIEELQEGLFDVFSSLDANAEEAEYLLKRVAEASVAGQSDVRSSLIPTIAIMNAYQRPLEDVDAILDTQFKTVQKGILTYDELNANIGKAIPAAVASGQTFETLGAMMAFMTRNGLNAAMAGTSAARALELLAEPKVTKQLEEAGIAVKDQNGEFRQMNEILTDLDDIFGGLTAPERKEKFKELFGTGRIQARRFFDIAIPNFAELNDLVLDFGDSAGSMQDAYDTMSETTAVQLDELRNRWELLRKEIGDNFIPQITQHLIPALDQVFDAWEGLSPDQQGTVAEWSAIGTLALTVGGALTTFAGISTLVFAVWGAFAKFMIPVLKVGGKFLGWAGLLATAGYYIWKNWDKIAPIWDRIVQIFKDGVEYLRPFVESVIELAQAQWDRAVDRARAAWEKLWPVLQEVAEAFIPMWEKAVDWWHNTAWPMVERTVATTFEMIETIIITAVTVISAIMDAAVATWTFIWENFQGTLGALVGGLWELIKSIFINGWGVIEGLMQVIIGVLTLDWTRIKEGLIQIWDSLWAKVVTILSVTWSILSNLFGELWALIQPHWEALWTSISDFFSNIWNNIVTFFQNIWNSDIVQFLYNVLGIIYEIVRISFWLVFGAIKLTLERIWNIIQIVFSAVWAFVQFIWDRLVVITLFAWEVIKGAIIDPVMAVWNFLFTIWTAVVSWLGDIWGGLSEDTQSFWTDIAGWIINPITEAIDGIFALDEAFDAGLRGLWETAQEWVVNIRDVLKKIDPREWFSPPITSQVQDGLFSLNDIMAGGLSTLAGTAASGVADTRAQFMSLVNDLNSMNFGNPLSQFGFSHGTSVDDILRAKAMQDAQAGFNPFVNGQALEPGQGQSGPTVQIGELHSNADPKEVAEEIAWQILTRAN